jgi:hypothetical protein
MLALFVGTAPSFGTLDLDLSSAMTNAGSIFNSMSSVLMIAISVGLAFYVARFLTGLIRR